MAPSVTVGLTVSETTALMDALEQQARRSLGDPAGASRWAALIELIGHIKSAYDAGDAANITFYHQGMHGPYVPLATYNDGS